MRAQEVRQEPRSSTGRTKTRIASALIAGLVAFSSFLCLALGVLLLSFRFGIASGFVMVLAVSIGLVGSCLIFRASYNGLTLRWSDEVNPPLFGKWVPWRIRDLV